MKKLWTDQKLVEGVAKSNSFVELFSFLEMKDSRAVRRRVNDLHLDASHWYRKATRPGQHRWDLKEILVQDSIYGNTSELKRKLLKAGLLNNKCYECQLTEWKKKPISLQLDHINGNNHDNRLCNLRILCPNCHSQTSTYAGRNTAKKVRRTTKSLVRYQCPHCKKDSTRPYAIACISCMRKHHLGPYARLFTRTESNEIVHQFKIERISITELAKIHKVSRDTISKIVYDYYAV